MLQHKKYDCVVIGAGHNGLVTAAYLAKAGKSVCLLERRSILGGCTTTEELWPGYRLSTAAYVISLFLPEIIRDLELNRQGLKILRRDPSSFTPLLDGRSLLMGHDRSATRQEISKFSRTDADSFSRYEAFLERVAGAIEPLLMQPAAEVLPLPRQWRSRGLWQRGRDLGRLWQWHRALGQLEEDLPEAMELLTGAARPLLERWFEAEVLRATLATDGIIGAFASISAPGTAYVLLHHVMGEAGGARGIWGYVAGGMGGLATALARTCTELHVDIRRESPVSRILTQAGRVTGICLEDGSVVESSVVASSVDAHWTFERLLQPADLPAEFRRAVARIDYSSASAKINLTLGELPRFTCLPSGEAGPHLHGTIHICPTLDHIERAYDDAKYGRPSAEPVLEMTIPSTVDDSLAPPGKYVASMFVQYAPYRLANANWDDIKEDFADRCVELLARYAPNIRGAVENRQILSPLDLERTYGLTGGNIMQGAMHLHQLYFCRPVAGWADHRTPVKGLYLCGAASHPGGGVIGACGRNAAQMILHDYR